MFAPLETIKIKSIYDGKDLPARLARCSSDMLAAVRNVQRDVDAAGGELVLSDMYRSYDMQLQAHLDYVNGKKTAYSPPPGGSMHEAGRAFDLELKALKVKLADFWKIAEKHGLLPIIDTPSEGADEAWHFDCRGSHDLVYQYYKAGKGDNFKKPYTAMAASAIVSTGVKVDALGSDPLPGFIQSGLIRLGQAIGDLDGRIGPKSRTAIKTLGLDDTASNEAIAAGIERLLQAAFPAEYFVTGEHDFALTETPVAFLTESLGAPGYSPSRENKAALGTIADMLAGAKPIDQDFKKQPKFLAMLGDKYLYSDSELQLDTDGWPEGKGKGDADWRKDTSLTTEDGSYINSNKVPYFVLPLPGSWSRTRGIDLGDYAAVIYKGKVTYAVFADYGPPSLFGEGSLQLLRALGEERIKSNGRVINAGTDSGVVTVVFPGSGKVAHRKDEATLIAAIQSEGARLFKALAT